MVAVTFPELLSFFSEKYKSELSEAALSSESVNIIVDEKTIQICKEENDTFSFIAPIGCFFIQPPLSQLQELLHANFLGIQTGGAVFSLDETFLQLHFTCTAGTLKLHYLRDFEQFYSTLCEWQNKLRTWPDFFLFPDIELQEAL